MKRPARRDLRNSQMGAARVTSPHSRSGWAWILVLFLTSVFQFLRGAPFDGAVFGLAAVALCLSKLQILSAGASAHPPSGWILVALVVAASVVLILLPTQEPLMALAVALIGIGALPTAWGSSAREGTPPRAPTRSLARAGALWALVAVLVCLWELSSFTLGLWSAAGTEGHPTISSLVEPLLSIEPWRTVLVVAWLTGGAALLHRGHRA